MKLRFRWNSSRRKLEGPAYPIRPRSFVASLFFHGAVIALALFGPSLPVSTPRPIYTELIHPLEDKIVWRDFREKLPDVASATKSPTPRGDQISRRTVVANSPRAKSATQFIWQPVPKIEIQQDLPLPNLVSRMVLPAPPAEEAKPPRPTKAFIPPSRTATPSPAPVPVLDPQAPAIPVAPPVLSAAKALPLPPKPTRAFVPPSRTPDTSSPAPIPLLDPQAPLIPLAAPSAPSVLSTAKALPLPPRPTKAFVPPSRSSNSSATAGQVPILDPQAPSINASSASAPSAPGAFSAGKGSALPALPGAPPPSSGNATADIAIASLHPADHAALPPGGARPGQFSEAPTKGAADAGDVNGVSVPNLAVRDPNPNGADIGRRDTSPSVREPPKKPVDSAMPALAPRTILYAERIRNIPVATLSAPLRPASRTIPRDIDARFQGRYVYAIVMPIENLPMYAGDWILWFAERNQRPGDSPSMRAPILFRKLESVEKVELPAQTMARFQLAGTITKEGRIEGISLLTRTGAVIEQALVRDLASWEFRPATRDGAPVDVEVVIEIPFNLKQIAEGGKP
jgi:hypothetical protein